MFEAEIEILKEQFGRIAQGLSSADVGNEGLLNENADNVEERFVALHLAIMKHTLNTMELALDQISTCVDVTRAMYFYQDQIIFNPEFWVEEDEVNGLLADNNRKMSFVDMQFLEALIQTVIIPLRDSYSDDAKTGLNREDLANRYIQLVARVDQENHLIYDLQDRVKAGLTLFEADQRPEIEHGSTPEKTLKAIHLKSALNAEMAIEQNLQTAQYFMAAIQLVQSRGYPAGIALSKTETLDYLQNRLELIIQRFDPLRDASDNRHGFTQLVFGGVKTPLSPSGLLR